MAKVKSPQLQGNAIPELPSAVWTAVQDRKPSTDSDALLAGLIEVWGGTRKLTLDLNAKFQ